MYQEIILDHYRNPHHKGLRDPYDVEVHHVNPTCGDEVTLRENLEAISFLKELNETTHRECPGCIIPRLRVE